MKVFVAVLLVLVVATNIAISAEEVEFRTVVVKNDKTIGGDFHLSLEIRIKNGDSPRTLSSFSADIYYGEELNNPTATGWTASPEEGYQLIAQAIGNNKAFRVGVIVLTLNGDGWEITTEWQKAVTVKWNIAKATSVNVSIKDSTNKAAYFKNLHNNPSNGHANWKVFNEDIGDVSLPVKLSSFTASADDTKVTLKWETGSEVGNIGFYVYRGETADGPFEKISKLIEGAGNSAMGRAYEYIDRKVEPNKTYFYYLEDIDIHSVRNKSNTIQVTMKPPLPKEYKLFQNYPNPFNPETWIPFQLPKAGEVTIRIYNTTGQLVKTIQLGYKQADMYVDKSKAAYWNGRNNMGEKLASGAYFYELRAGAFRSSRKMLLLK